MAEPWLRLDGVTCRSGERELWPAGLSADIDPGITWVGGDEGTGKTTLLRLLAGRLAPSQGRLIAPRSTPPRVAWVDPAQPFDDRLTAREALAQGLQPFGGGEPGVFAELVQSLDLQAHLDKALYMLSTGSRRKVGIAITLASGADVLLFDQPFMALDRPSEKAIVDGWSAVVAAGRSVVVADYLPPTGIKPSAQIDLDRWAM